MSWLDFVTMALFSKSTHRKIVRKLNFGEFIDGKTFGCLKTLLAKIRI